ncbi:MAG: SDR family NAD(P)-dependent oxidoreductase [Mastigocoleus sp. MO_167.B18]|uniref:SDR family NAD(P)-dependent oxidoreductase n=1 Tax=Mastigocoleus sp. MO_188.B34 TaxID=3036635 RepID=UPI00262A54D3|nr:SDR family NAD(P)-dependent oxidoreductase [Mastigocoleus sp. MO_188.B34]MDJ0697855.1 SDR family NAD(P)-dependent oxidoreductase [Mastigocoleus sp. MO_188.B34]MDJ0772693.1 SDR family NAD(P)-dependent oxidoreductase [Mastigocoleus sp. MO_167.B18]
MNNSPYSHKNDELIELLSKYFSHRGNFLAQVIRADLQSSPFLASKSKNTKKNKSLAIPEPKADAPVEVSPVAITNSVDKESQQQTVSVSVEDIVIDLVVEQTGYPRDSINLQVRLLDDLNLDSIKSAELVSQVAKKIGVQGQVDPSYFANATLAEVAQAFKELSNPQQPPEKINQEATPGIFTPVATEESTSWTRNFTIEYVPQEAAAISSEEQKMHNSNLFAVDNWEITRVLIVSEAEEADLVTTLSEKLQQIGAQVEVVSFGEMVANSLIEKAEFTHFIAVLPQNIKADTSPETRLRRAMERLHAVATPPPSSQGQREYTSVSYIQFGGGYFGKLHQIGDIEQGCTIGFASTLHLERSDLKVRIIDLPGEVEPDSIIEPVIEEISRSDAFLAVGYDSELIRRVPRPIIQDRTLYENRNISWSSSDVFLITGGAKGITAECALALARVTGVKMALVGSSPHPQDNPMGNSSPEIARILRRFRDEELTCQYYQCDVANTQAITELVEQIEKDLGNITGVVHGAAVNKARRVDNCSLAEAEAEIAPKVLGIFNLCRALEDKPPKLFAGISSIGAVIGLPGNSWYSFSNEVLDQVLRRFGQQHPETSVLSIAYSVWDEVGMGVRMGTIRNLGRMGIKAIPKNEGVNRFVQLMQKDPGETQVVITSRLGSLQILGRGFDTWRIKPFSRPAASKFIGQLDKFYFGLEITLRTHLSLEKDSYVKDHVYKGSYLFPTVFGLEAMAQTVAYTVGQEKFQSVHIEDIRLERPIVVNPENGVEIELRAEVLERESKNAPQRVLAEIRTEQTGFTTAHFAATFVLGKKVEPPIEEVKLPQEPLAIEPKQDLYSWLLFQGPRFQRLEQIYSLDSKKMIFRTQRSTGDEGQESLDRAEGPFLLGDPYYRDSLLQSIQPMVPQDLGLPIGIKGIQIYQIDTNGADSCIGVAQGETRKGKQYNTNVFSVDEQGRVIEKLEGYQLQMIDHRPDHPTAEELANPGVRNEKLLYRELVQRAAALNVTVPQISLMEMPGMHNLSAEERHQQELPIFSQTVDKVLNNLE